MLELINGILEFFWDCFPRPVTVASNERASRFLFGRDFDGTRLEPWVRQDFGPGFYILLPLLEDWDQRVVASQHQYVDEFLCSTKDGYVWRIGMDVEFEITDLPSFDICQHNGDEHIETLSRGEAIREAASRTHEAMLTLGPHSFGVAVHGRIEEKLHARGVNVINARCMTWHQTVSLDMAGMHIPCQT